jgi:uncharacterized protein YjaZ
MYTFSFLFFISLFLLGCSDETSKMNNEGAETPKTNIEEPETPIIGSMTITHNEQQFKITNYFQEYVDYVEKAKDYTAGTGLYDLYQRTVLEPFRKKAFSENEDFEAFEKAMSNELTNPTDIKELENTIQMLLKNEHKIMELIQNGLKKSADKLPAENKSIHIFPAHSSIPGIQSYMKELGGITGWTLGKDFIFILIDPTFQESHVISTIAHEYHHTVYLEKLRPASLLDSIIIEGEADTFAKIIEPNVQTPWTAPLSDDKKQLVWKYVKPSLNEYNETIYDELFGGSPSRGIPKWANYRIGYNIMESFLKENPNTSIREWTEMPVEEILKRSKFEEKYIKK